LRDTVNAVVRRWTPDAMAGLVVLVLGLAETTANWRYSGGPATATLVVILATGVAVALSRHAPGLALMVVWLSLLIEVLGTVLVEYQAPVMVVQAVDLAVLYGTARWGRPLVVWLGALSVPVGAAVVVAFLGGSVAGAVAPIAGVQWLLQLGYQFGGHLQITAGVLGLLLLAVPWLLGLVVRVRASAATEAAVAASEIAQVTAAREQASELAGLRAEQARLARDVHDVVGHSLAVILAQAESAQYLPDEDPAALKATLATVADSARTSLRDIRQVLAATRDEVGADGLDRLLEGVRSGGREVLSTQAGSPVVLDAERAEIAYRVLQEMLTNAIRHGRRDSAIVVRRDWAGDQLVIEVRNGVAGDAASITPGQGLTGMAERLRAVDGRLAFVRRGEVFATTATIPEVRE
jgi:signal transduction histidine kinase